MYFYSVLLSSDSIPAPPTRPTAHQVSALLLKEYRSQFKGAPLTSTYRFLGQLVSSSLPSNPLITYDTDVRYEVCALFP